MFSVRSMLPLFPLVLTLTGCSSPKPASEARAPAPPATPRSAVPTAGWVLTPRAFGSVQIGWTVAQLNAELGDSLRPTYEISDRCDQLAPVAFPSGTSIMVLDDTIVRIDVYDPGVLTAEGAGVGDSEARLLQLYGARAQVTPHKYHEPLGHYVTVPDAADHRRMTIFETDGLTVLNFRAGVVPGVQFVEGCA